MYRVSRVYTTIPCALALFAAGIPFSPAFAQENAPSGEKRTTLPPVEVMQHQPSKKPAAVKKDRAVAGSNAAQNQAGDRRPAGLLGAEGLPSRSELSTAASALPAASTTLDTKRLERAPVSTYGDLFRSLPGFDVANYGQGSIGYGMAMRGYSEGDHGRDIAYFIDGVPVNDISSSHTPGYADLNILIPETVARIEVIRGPFSVEAGDGNLGGAVFITTKSSDPYASLNMSGGSWGTGRGVATYGSNNGTFEPYVAAELYHTDAYRDNGEIDRYNTFNKVTIPLGGGDTLTFRAQAYGTESGASGYISRSALQSGLISPATAVNPADGYEKTLQNFVVDYASGPAAQQLTGLLYFTHTNLTRYSDFCELNLPWNLAATPCQGIQHEERETVGGKLRKVWTGEVAGMPVQFLSGASWRTDFISDFSASTIDRVIQPGNPSINMSNTETDLAGFAQLQVKPVSWLKLTAGARFDQFYYNVDAAYPYTMKFDFTPAITSPKAGVAITPFRWLELYANYGQGFRSPDAVTELVQRDLQSLQPFKIESAEVGGKIQTGRFAVQAAFYKTDAQNEAYQPVPDWKTTFLGPTRREGYDLDARYAVLKERGSEVALFGNYSAVDAYRLDAARGFVPGVPVYTSNLGVDFSLDMGGGERLLGQAYIGFIGKKYLTEDGQLTTSPYQRVSAKAGYAWPSGWSAFTQATWYPGDRYSEFAIDFADPVHASATDIYTAPVPEFTVLAGFSYRIPTTKLAMEEGLK
jgi:outer membrane receptor protein involved in Fe transport